MIGIEEYDKFGTLTKLYYSIQSAANELNISKELLTKIIDNNELYNRRFYKYYHYSDFGSNKIIIYPIKQYNVQTGEVINQFKTITDAAKTLGYHRNSISKCIQSNGTVVDKWGYGWKKNFDVD